MSFRNPAAKTLGFVDTVFARTDEENAGQNETDFDRGQRVAKSSSFCDRKRVTDSQEKNEQDPDAKKQTDNDQDAADASEERAQKSPKLNMRMQTPGAGPGAEMGPRGRASQKRRRGIENEENADTYPEQQQAEIGVFREKGHSHGGTLNS